MKVTLHIDDGHAPALIQLLAALLDKATALPVEGTTDPAPGHPELPLEANRTEPWDEEPPAGTYDGNDRTRQRIPWPSHLASPPPLPSGKLYWIYRGRFSDEDFATDKGTPIYPDREIRYWSEPHGEWLHTASFSGDMPHIEAV